MKKLLALFVCFSVLLVCLCGCDAKNENVSSENASSDNVKTSTGYFHTYEGEPLPNKKYTIYSSPRSGVKEGIANDPESEILAVKDATKLYFGFVSGCDIEYKPYTYITTEKTSDIDVPRGRIVEYNGKKYFLSYHETETVVETHTFEGEEYQFGIKKDKYSVYNESEDKYYGQITIRRDTDTLVEFKINNNLKSSADANTLKSNEEAQAKIVQYVKELCGEDAIEDFKIEVADIHKSNGYRISSTCSIGEYKTRCSLYVRISEHGDLLELRVHNNKEASKTAFERYGKEAFDKAKAVLESAVELPGSAQFYIAFDSDGKLFLVVTTNKSYPQTGPVCDGIHPMHYAVEII